MRIRTERADAAVILHLEGRLSVETDAAWLSDAMDAITNPGVRHALLDFREVGQLDCTGIGQLVRLRKLAHGARRTFGLVGVERRQKRLLELSGLLHVFRVFGDCDAALAALATRQGPAARPAACPPLVPAMVGVRMVACWTVAAALTRTECVS